MKIPTIVTLLLLLLIVPSIAFIPTFAGQKRSFGTLLYDVEGDWKEFRDKLIKQEKLQQQGQNGEHEQQKQQSLRTSDVEESWVVEQNRLEPGFVLIQTPTRPNVYGLSNQFLYKSVILILEQTGQHTIGLVLNRPTDMTLEDEDNADTTFSLFYGGDHASFHSDDPAFHCLHLPSSSTAAAAAATTANQQEDATTVPSTPVLVDTQTVMAGLSFVSLDEAKAMCVAEQSTPKDFLLTCGYISWPTELFHAELESGEWKSLSMDSKTLEQALKKKSAAEAWEHLLALTDMVNMVDSVSTFDERMLEEWSNTHLMFEEDDVEDYDDEAVEVESGVQAGDLLRSSSHTHAFLFDNQEFHKSLMLVLQEDDDFSVAVLLNHPTTEIEATTQLPIRYGGNFDQLDVDEEMPAFCLHRLGGVIGGELIGDTMIWKASISDAEEAIRQELAQPSDFLVIQGLSIWDKSEGNGLDFHVADGMFDIVDRSSLDEVWERLQGQQRLTASNIDDVLDASYEAWKLSGGSVIEDSEEEMKLHSLGLDAVGVWLTKQFLADEW